eukprot:gb/GEZN01006138.1/.p1 GENE.gb/GEZN01006138.1/~~gb/GEZN01006138.1/.p1  ORF type:complete len:381 (+),score=49.24 gb/GEZN01006138.1/:28-1143(+)
MSCSKTGVSAVIKPISLKGHERPLTKIKFNRENDLLVTCGKDKKVSVWYTSNGERLGTFNGHDGGVWDCDISWDSKRLVTGSSDRTARLWDLETGRCLHVYQFKSGVRSARFSHGDSMLALCTDAQYGQQPTVYLYNLDKKHAQQSDEPVRQLLPVDGEGNPQKIKMFDCIWGHLNFCIYACCDDGSVRIFDVEKGVEVDKKVEHKAAIYEMQFSKDGTMFVTASADSFAKLWDTKEFKVLREFPSDRPLNTAAISPIMNHIIIGGGQEAISVTTTAAQMGHFEVDFLNMVTTDYLGSVKGHFGPVHTLAFSPNGKSYASGSEDGYVRLHHFPPEYLVKNDLQIGVQASVLDPPSKKPAKKSSASTKKEKA